MKNAVNTQWPNKPVYYYFNINQEQRWNESNVFPQVTELAVVNVIQQQEQQVMFAANKGDTVLLHHQPDDDFLKYLTANGIQLPNFQYIEGYDSIPWPQIKEAGAIFAPYIMTSQIEEDLKRYRIECVFGNSALVKQINNKLITRELAIKNGFNVTQGYVCENLMELENSYSQLKKKGYEKIVIKIPYGSSGKGLRVVNSDKTFRTLSRYISKRFTNFQVLIEGWEDIERSINGQIWIGENTSSILEITEQQINDDAVYTGTNYSPAYSPHILEMYKEELNKLCEVLHDMGYRGVAGTDSIISKQGELFPVIEINARFTQVTYLLNLTNELKKNYQYVSSQWVSFSAIDNLGFSDLLEQCNKFMGKGSSKLDFFIYTFAKSKWNDTYHYRIFLMIMANELIEAPNFISQLVTFVQRKNY